MLKWLLSLLAAVGVWHFCSLQTDKFMLYKITERVAPDSRWHTDAAAPLPVFDQPFYYLGKGAQSFVFLSADKQYVIKFFKLHHLRAPLWVQALPFCKAYRSQKMAHKKEALDRTFESYTLAFRELKDETGLVYVHLNPTDHLHKKLTLFDKIHIAHEVDLDEVCFLVQKRADLVYPSLEHWMLRGEVEKAKEGISSILSILVARRAKGLYDKDVAIERNFGFIDNRAIQIDCGAFQKKEPSAGELVRVTDDLKKWLEERYPELAAHLEQEIACLSG